MRLPKRNRLVFFLALALPALLMAAACGPSAPAEPAPVAPSEQAAVMEPETAAMPQESVVAVSFSNDVMTPETIRVKQDDQVTLNLESDRPGSFHIHGYDLEQEAVVGEVTRFEFVANATGRFVINFHGAAEPGNKMADEMDMSSAGGHDQSGMAGGGMDHGSMDHGPAESAVPVSLDIAAQVSEGGGVHVPIEVDGWRWAPEEVNGPNSDGAGHAHIYADGVKLSRVYGDYHYIQGLEPGVREIKVSLNSNDHSELTWQGSKLESVVSVTVPEMASMSHHDMASMKDPVEAEAPMSLEVIAHEDSLGGYNLQVIPSGFEFSQSEGQGHEPGMGYAQLTINDELFNRLYVPWLQVPAQGEGMHTFTVTLLNNEGQPYQHNGQAVEMTVMVHEKAKAEVGDGPAMGHHDTGSAQHASGGHHGSAGASGGHHGGGTGASAEIVEFEIGYLEVLP